MQRGTRDEEVPSLHAAVPTKTIKPSEPAATNHPNIVASFEFPLEAANSDSL